jgi:hypothetical protein
LPSGLCSGAKAENTAADRHRGSRGSGMYSPKPNCDVGYRVDEFSRGVSELVVLRRELCSAVREFNSAVPEVSDPHADLVLTPPEFASRRPEFRRSGDEIRLLAGDIQERAAEFTRPECELSDPPVELSSARTEFFPNAPDVWLQSCLYSSRTLERSCRS